MRVTHEIVRAICKKAGITPEQIVEVQGLHIQNIETQAHVLTKTRPGPDQMTQAEAFSTSASHNSIEATVRQLGYRLENLRVQEDVKFKIESMRCDQLMRDGGLQEHFWGQIAKNGKTNYENFFARWKLDPTTGLVDVNHCTRYNAVQISAN